MSHLLIPTYMEEVSWQADEERKLAEHHTFPSDMSQPPKFLSRLLLSTHMEEVSGEYDYLYLDSGEGQKLGGPEHHTFPSDMSQPPKFLSPLLLSIHMEEVSGQADYLYLGSGEEQKLGGPEHHIFPLDMCQPPKFLSPLLLSTHMEEVSGQADYLYLGSGEEQKLGGPKHHIFPLDMCQPPIFMDYQKPHREPCPSKRRSRHISRKLSQDKVIKPLNHRQKHGTAVPRLPFICDFKFAGCEREFGSRNEWKRHVETQHLQTTAWVCCYDDCPNQIFNRRDLFSQHLRRMHLRRFGKDSPTDFCAREGTKNQLQIRDEEEAAIPKMQEQCKKRRRSAPINSRCIFCKMEFQGEGSWEHRMDHVGRHYESLRSGVKEKVGRLRSRVEKKVDRLPPPIMDQWLIEWALQHEIIEEVKGMGKAMQVEQGEEVKTNAPSAYRLRFAPDPLALHVDGSQPWGKMKNLAQGGPSLDEEENKQEGFQSSGSPFSRAAVAKAVTELGVRESGLDGDIEGLRRADGSRGAVVTKEDGLDEEDNKQEGFQSSGSPFSRAAVAKAVRELGVGESGLDGDTEGLRRADGSRGEVITKEDGDVWAELEKEVQELNLKKEEKEREIKKMQNDLQDINSKLDLLAKRFCGLRQ